jgi:hypothetical protein
MSMQAPKARKGVFTAAYRQVRYRLECPSRRRVKSGWMNNMNMTL